MAPAKQTPRELKPLSDIDDQAGLRFHVPIMMVYGSHPPMEGKNPAKVIKEALATALVYYYPLAGRLLEEPDRKLVVDCTGEGVLFREADADITLEEALGGDGIVSPPVLDEFLCDDLPGILGCPMISFQVTRLTCGGFIVTSILLHAICDGIGFSHFLQAIAEIARGAQAPSVLPTWHREALNARNPPRVTCTHHEYEEDVPVDKDNQQKYWARDDIVRRFFFFGPKELQALRAQLPPHLRASTFEILTACLWRCRTAALELPPHAAIRVAYCMNVRQQRLLEVPPGYYGNAFVYPAVTTTVESLCKSSLEHAIKVVKKVKAQVSEDYVRSVADLMVIKGRPSHTMATQFILSDNRKIGFEELDFGWGYPLYCGASSAVDFISFFVSFKNGKGEDGVAVSIALDEAAMEKFDEELKKFTQ